MIICFSLSTETSFNSACARRRCSVVDVLFRSLFAIYCDEFEIPSSPQLGILFRWLTTLNLVSVGISKHHAEDLTSDSMRAGPESDPNLQLNGGSEPGVV